jgi:hypothetical protein
MISGLAGNGVRLAISNLSKSMGWGEVTGREISAGMFLTPQDVISRKGKLVGFVADNVVAVMLGVSTVYLLSVTGRDKAWLKGLASGEAMWASLYGVMATMGATRLNPVNANTALTELIAHSAFGMTTAAVAVKLGDPSLFTGKLPLSASPLAEEQEENNHPVTRRRRRRGTGFHREKGHEAYLQ